MTEVPPPPATTRPSHLDAERTVAFTEHHHWVDSDELLYPRFELVLPGDMIHRRHFSADIRVPARGKPRNTTDCRGGEVHWRRSESLCVDVKMSSSLLGVSPGASGNKQPAWGSPLRSVAPAPAAPNLLYYGLLLSGCARSVAPRAPPATILTTVTGRNSARAFNLLLQNVPTHKTSLACRFAYQKNHKTKNPSKLSMFFSIFLWFLSQTLASFFSFVFSFLVCCCFHSFVLCWLFILLDFLDI